MKRMYLIFSFLMMGVIHSFAQIREIPKEVREQFSRQYPMATDVDFNDNLLNINVEFTLENEKWTAEYNNKGVWKHSEKKWTYEQLPEAVKDGFQKSKYADREVKSVIMIYYPGDMIQYRIKTEKSAVERKYLYFNPQGRLLRETITI
jgi:hypothetical protein